ncbi:hypothetical protein TEA_025824 [Camellia sinensis var. sinensis]|uniref:Uncharacterized protein n=1 Tax=Camellia sinensis var. sinensis TaxID=542762 RepID=A0A4S4E4L2_CAMSN|nr:hypothetical protein TEA_025824 [Camellia sinensis var. sinensis]
MQQRQQLVERMHCHRHPRGEAPPPPPPLPPPTSVVKSAPRSKAQRGAPIAPEGDQGEAREAPTRIATHVIQHDNEKSTRKRRRVKENKGKRRVKENKPTQRQLRRPPFDFADFFFSISTTSCRLHKYRVLTECAYTYRYGCTRTWYAIYIPSTPYKVGYAMGMQWVRRTPLAEMGLFGKDPAEWSQSIPNMNVHDASISTTFKLILNWYGPIATSRKITPKVWRTEFSYAQ